MAPRIRTFRRGAFTLWFDRVPVIHGRANILTLWRRESDGRERRLFGGLLVRSARARILELAA